MIKRLTYITILILGSLIALAGCNMTTTGPSNSNSARYDLVGEINHASAYSLTQFLEKNSHRKVTIYVESQGGMVISGYAMNEAVRRHGNVHFVVPVKAYSMAAILITQGKSVKVYPHAKIIFHLSHINGVPLKVTNKEPWKAREALIYITKLTSCCRRYMDQFGWQQLLKGSDVMIKGTTFTMRHRRAS